MKKGVVVGVIIAVVGIAAVLGWYFILRPGKVVESSVRMEIKPSPARIGDHVTITVYVTNGKASTMVVDDLTLTAYQNDRLQGTSSGIPPGVTVTRTIPPGETIAIFSYRAPEPLPSDAVGIWRFELTCHTNFGDLKTTYTFTILS